MGTIIRSSRKRRSWLAWSGETVDLLRLGKMIEDSFQQRQSQLQAERERLAEQEDEGRESHLQTMSTAARDVFITGATAVFFNGGTSDEEIPSYPFVGMVLVDDETVSGDISDVFPEIDRRSLQRVSFISAFHPRERIAVTFARNGSEAVFLQVESSDSGWARQGIARIAEEVEKGVPRWSFMRGRSLPTLSIRALAATAIGSAIAISVPSSTLVGGPTQRVFLGVLVGLVLLGIQFLPKFRDFLFPPFELLGEGASASGSRRIAATVLLAASLPIGIFVNWVS